MYALGQSVDFSLEKSIPKMMSCQKFQPTTSGDVRISWHDRVVEEKWCTDLQWPILKDFEVSKIGLGMILQRWQPSTQDTITVADTATITTAATTTTATTATTLTDITNDRQNIFLQELFCEACSTLYNDILNAIDHQTYKEKNLYKVKVNKVKLLLLDGLSSLFRQQSIHSSASEVSHLPEVINESNILRRRMEIIEQGTELSEALPQLSNLITSNSNMFFGYNNH
uniref:Mediator of RNA polymerase II transcription subunit 7 n=1 Tax=Elaeophora elaphi TaxID=1147741 RepID=A0A0R3S217_9BILA